MNWILDVPHCHCRYIMISGDSGFGSVRKIGIRQSRCGGSTETGSHRPVVARDGERSTTCEGVRCELVDYQSLPDYLKDNELILRHYRSEWPLKQTLLSIFSIHNETINVWTHLAGFFLFLVLTLHAAAVLPNTAGAPPVQVVTRSAASDLCKAKTEAAAETYPSYSSSSSEHLGELVANCSPWKKFAGSINLTDDATVLQSLEEGDVVHMMTASILVEPVTRWPFFAFLYGAMFCLLTSSICHLISCHSEQMAYVMLRLDYAGIAALIVTSFYPLVFYSFMCRPFLCNLYMGFITAFGAVTVSVSLVPAFQTAEFRTVRAGIFFCMGFSGLVPIMHKLFAFSHRPEVVLSAGYELLMGSFYGLGVAVYTARIPERWVPGRFDLVGHSHQLFHLLVIAGAYAHYLAGRVYLQWRSVDHC